MGATDDDNRERRGFHEIEHTADWSIEVWAPDFEGLLLEATRGMYTLAGVELGAPESDEPETVVVDGDDRVDLTVAWLSEVVFAWSAHREGWVDLELACSQGRVEATGYRAPIVSQGKDVKAVTYHGLDVRETDRGLEATVTFDV